MTGTSLAALTYGGFDGVSTLSEDVENPRKNILDCDGFRLLFHRHIRRPADLPGAANLARDG